VHAVAGRLVGPSPPGGGPPFTPIKKDPGGDGKTQSLLEEAAAGPNPLSISSRRQIRAPVWMI
jgi:hypothetical protein